MPEPLLTAVMPLSALALGALVFMSNKSGGVPAVTVWEGASTFYWLW